MTIHPCGEQIRFVRVDYCDQGGNFAWWSGSESSFLIFGGLDDPGKEDGPNKRDDGEYDERERANATDVTERVSGLFDRRMLFVAEIGFTNPSRAVK